MAWTAVGFAAGTNLLAIDFALPGWLNPWERTALGAFSELAGACAAMRSLA